MKVRLSIFSLCAFLILYVSPASAVVDVKNPEVSQEVSKEEVKRHFKDLSAKKQKRLKKRIAKLKKKFEKRAPIDSGIFQDSKFRLGAVVFLGGLGLLILAGIFIGFSSAVIWIANLAILVGLVLMIWALIEY